MACDLPFPMCHACPLNTKDEDRRHVYSGQPGAPILIVGEAPGAEEEKLGEPFVGRAGKKLRELMRAVGLDESQVAMTNTVLCRPPGNREPTREELQACSENLEALIKHFKPRLIVPLGNVALRRLLKTSGITKKAGTLYEHERYGKVLPSLHPSYVLRGTDPGAEKVLKRDLAQAKALVDGKQDRALKRWEIVTTTDQLDRLVEDIEKAELVAFDVETAGLEPDPDLILGFGFSWEEGRAAFVPWMWNEDLCRVWYGKLYWMLISPTRRFGSIPSDAVGAAWAEVKRYCAKLERVSLVPFWPDGKETKVRRALQTIFKAPATFVAHNAKYDVKRALMLGLGLKEVEDTLLIHFLCDENRAHDLKDIAKEYGELNYDVPSSLLAKGAVPLPPLAEYCCTDAAVTWLEYRRRRPELEKDPKLVGLYEALYKPLVFTYARSELKGVRLDQEAIREKHKEVSDRLFEIKDLVERERMAPLNLSSGKQLSMFLFDELKLPVLKRTATGAPSTDWETLKSLEDRHRVVPLLIEFRKLSKILSTYVVPYFGQNRIYFSYRLHGARTGRLSSSPNVQNIPSDIRRFFLPDEDELWLSADAAQIELRLLAWYSQDPVMLREFREGIDLHSATAELAYGDYFRLATGEKRKTLRHRAKTSNFSSWYGGSPETLMQTINKDQPKKNWITQREAKALQDAVFRKYHVARSYVDKVHRHLKRFGALRSVTGRVIRTPQVWSSDPDVASKGLRQGFNSLIQGTASDLIQFSFVEVDRALEERGLGRVLLTVHDSIECSVRPDGAEEAAKIVYGCFLKVAESFGIDFLDMDAAVGLNWKEVEEIDKEVLRA